MRDLIGKFNKALRAAKTPRQVYGVYHKYSDIELARIGSIALAYSDDYINNVGVVLKNDVVRKNYKHKLTKQSAKELMLFIEKYSNKLFRKLGQSNGY